MRFLARFIMALVVIVAFLLITLAVVCNTSLGAHVFESWMMSQRSVPLRKIEVGGVRSNLFSFLNLRNISAEAMTKGPKVTYRAKQVEVESLNGMWGLAHAYQLDVQSLSIDSPNLIVQDLTGSIPFLKHGELSQNYVKQDNLRLQTLKASPYAFSNLSGRIWAQDNILYIHSMKSEAYRGHLKGDITYHQKTGAYSASFKIENLDLTEMQSIGAPLFEKASGLVSGWVEAHGTQGQTRKFETELTVSKDGGTINADLVRPLLKYLPMDESMILSSSFESTELIKYRFAKLRITQVSPLTYFVDVKITTTTIPIDLSVKIDVHLDANPVEEIRHFILGLSGA